MKNLVFFVLIVFLLISNRLNGQPNDIVIKMELTILLYNVKLNYVINNDSVVVYETNDIGNVNELIYKYRYNELEKDTLNTIVYPYLMKKDSSYIDDGIIDVGTTKIQVFKSGNLIKEVYIKNSHSDITKWLKRLSKFKTLHSQSRNKR